MKNIFIVIYVIITIISLPSFAQEEENHPQLKFGPEWTFSRKEIIEAVNNDLTMTSTEVSDQYLHEIKELVTKFCSWSGCKLSQYKNTENAEVFRVTYQDGFYWEFMEDPQVLEVITKPLTIEQMTEPETYRRQKLIFKIMSMIGLRPQERIGGGHIHVGFKESFENDRKAFRNFIVDEVNNYLARLAFNISPFYAPSLAMLPFQQRKNFKNIIEKFDHDESMTIEDLCREINEKVYYKNPADLFPSMKYQALNFTRIVSKSLSPEERTLEFRDIRPQQDLDHYILTAQLIEKRINRIKEISKDQLIPYENPSMRIKKKSPLAIEEPEKVVAAYQKYVSEVGLPWARYSQYLPVSLSGRKLPLSKKTPDRNKESTQENGLNEIFDADGNIRPFYIGPYNILNRLRQQTPERISRYEAQSKEDLDHDNAIHHFPRILSPEENEILKKGVDQRGKAILAFLKDHYSSNPIKKYQKDNIFPPGVLKNILLRSGESELQHLISPEQILFWYAPDIIHGKDGNHYVLEDNPGYVGGMGDLHKAPQSILKRFPEIREFVQKPQGPSFFLRQKNLLSKIGKDKGGKIVLLRYKNSLLDDNEDKRIEKLFARYGIETVILNPSRSDLLENPKQLVVESDGVYLKHNQQIEDAPFVPLEKVSTIIASLDPFDLDPQDPSMQKRFYLLSLFKEYQKLKKLYEKLVDDSELEFEKAQAKKELEMVEDVLFNPENLLKHDLKRIKKFALKLNPYLDIKKNNKGVPHILEAFFQKKINIINPPGFEFIGDKEFYVYIDKLVRTYLGEEPILKNLPSSSFSSPHNLAAGQSQIDDSLIQEVFAENGKNKDKYVIKGVNGRGGDAVWVGPKITKEEFMKLEEMVRKDPNNFIVQHYMPLSELDNHLIDIRLHTLVTPIKNKEITPAKNFFARGVPVKGSNGKVNISDKGKEFVVFLANTHRPAHKTQLIPRQKINTQMPFVRSYSQRATPVLKQRGTNFISKFVLPILGSRLMPGIRLPCFR